MTEVANTTSTPTTPSAADPERGLSMRHLALVFGFALCVLLPGLGSSRVLTAHEVFVAQPAREMLESGDWLVPRFIGEPRMKKPPMMNWVVAGSMALFGSGAAWVVRLPSVLSAAVLACAIALLAARWFGPRVGVIAGLINSATAYVWIQARLAEADMPLCAAVAVALTAFAFACVAPSNSEDAPTRPRSPWHPVIFYAATGVSFLIKSVIGPVFILGAAGAYAVVCAWRDRDFKPVRVLLHPIGLPLFVVLVAAWPVGVIVRMPEIAETWRSQLLGRAMGELGGRKPFGFYGYTILWTMLPWTPLLIVAFFRKARTFTWRQAAFLLCWMVPGLVVLQFSAFKHKHYVMPLLAPLVIVAAVQLEQSMRRTQSTSRRAPIGWCAAILLMTLAGTIAAALLLTEARWCVSIIVAAIGLGAAAFVRWQRRPQAQFGVVLATIWVCTTSFFVLGMHQLDGYRPYTDLAERTLKRVDGKPVYMIALGESQFAYYLGGSARRCDLISDLAELIDKQGGGWLYGITRSDLVDRLQADYVVEQLDETEPNPAEPHAKRRALVRLRNRAP